MFNASPFEQEATPAATEYKKGENQGYSCKDAPFAILFVLHLGVMGFVIGFFSIDPLVASIRNDAQNENEDNYTEYIYLSALLGCLSFILASFMLSFMMKYANILIKISLLFSIACSLVAALLSVASGSIGGFVVCLIFFGFSVCYAKIVWSRIPFATANLITSLTAVKSNCGIVILSYFFVILAFLWTLVWTLALVGVNDATQACQEIDGNQVCEMNYGYLFLLFVSFFWTHQVITNTLQVTVSGLVGTWWFSPAEAQSFCSSGVTSSLYRATTSSFGSICFGSLLVAIIQALRQIANQARANDDGNGILLCIADCILSCLESLLEYFNKWAYVYVGLYGYGYVEAGKNVMGLFKSRGFEAIVADDLVSNALILVSLITGLLMGGLAYLIDQFNWFDISGEPWIAFLLGFLIGLVLTSIMLTVVGGAVNTTIVCFAEAPAEFQANHPILSNQMRAAWNNAYPGSGDY